MGSVLSNEVNKGKRSWSEANDDDEEESEDTDQVIEIPKSKRPRRTSGYIYQTLFKDGEGSDITIAALGKQWKLHKIYLKQSGYFQGMLSGSWKESTEDFITIQVPDDNVTVEALDVAFGSLYNDDVMITPATVISLLAAASLLQLDSLNMQCCDAMLETINASTVCAYYAAAQVYGELAVEKRCMQWFERRICSSWTVQLLQNMSIDLMEQVIKSPNLFVMQIEVDLYTLLVMWTYIKLHPSWEGQRKDLRGVATGFLQQRNQLTDTSLLESDEGKPFVPAFRAVRLEHVINDARSVQLLENDNVLPQDWLHPLYKAQWTRMLTVYQNLDTGPSTEMTVDKFNLIAQRYGRILERNTRYCWRWTGFLYGLDIIILYNNVTGKISLRRNTYIHPTHGVVCVQQQHSFVIRVDVAAFPPSQSKAEGPQSRAGEGQAESYFGSSGQQYVTLGLDEEVQILQVDLTKASYPLHISTHIALVRDQIPQL
ncbi:predicted protein [Nematostella vectensis]|uniref:BTB domain-containing protein n=1 Tax=Nematostella vectensis TaxID=45351 RepID=A7S106_NEMVE|nr:germ cell-less protein-like 1 [Nematostella vectensis]EDO42633.1 predicted protein [Nematostella vectensis]|eukprot:XP_001634696.1 predicted protein [Nematostella vectensis]